jgi:GAF domain-containing protein
VTGTGFSPVELSVLFADIGEQLSAVRDSASTLRALTSIAVERVPGAMYAGVTVGREGRPFTTVAATDGVVEQVDEIQYQLGTGPCVDAVIANTTFNAADLRTDARWPEFGSKAFETAGIVSMLSIRLYIEADLNMIAGINTYSQHADAFTASSETVATLLATHGSLAVGRASAREQAQNLRIALDSSREIGIAMGIVMAVAMVTRDQAFDLLRIASQRLHRKLRDIATEIVDTGALPELPSAR